MVTHFDSKDIRNIALLGHGGCGKTALGEAMLFDTGATTRLGDTIAGTSTFDFSPEERNRGGSIASAIAWTEHDGRKLNIIDTPGDANFVYDAIASMRGADAAFVVVSAPDGVEVQTERLYREAERRGLPRLVVINKMDRERADAQRVLDDFESNLGVRPVPLQVPIGRETAFNGVVSLLQRKGLFYTPDGSGEYERGHVPDDLRETVDRAWETLVEAVASTDDELLEKYLETFELSAEEVRAGLRRAIRSGELVPAVYTSATANIGVHAVLDLASWACPNPLERRPEPLQSGGELEPRADGGMVARTIRTFDDEFGPVHILRIFAGSPPDDGVVFNLRNGEEERFGTLFALRGDDRDTLERAVAGEIIAVPKLHSTRYDDTLASDADAEPLERMTYPEPMMRYTISVSPGDEDKLRSALERILAEDPTLSTRFDPDSDALLLRGMGQQHLDLAVEKMARKHDVEVELGMPRIPYRETIRKRVSDVEGKHRRQSGGVGQFGVCILEIEPLPRGEGFEFETPESGPPIPGRYIPAVIEGLQTCMAHGPVAGYPVTDIRVTLVDGKFHAVDSSDAAYRTAAMKGLREALVDAAPKLLEPMYEMEIRIPTASMGDIMGDVTARRGRVLGMEPAGRYTVVRAICPLAEIRRYAPDLRSMTHGQGTFSMAFGGYEELPENQAAAVVSASPHLTDEDG